jgi:hypothetical protein
MRVADIFGAMTKAENRAAAGAFERSKSESAVRPFRAEIVKTDLAALETLRNYLIKSRTAGHSRELIDAIDDDVEQITGDRTTLHTRHHGIGVSASPNVTSPGSEPG